MFYFNIQRFGGGGTTQTTVPEHFADRTKFPGLDTATNQQMQYNDLASMLSQGLLGNALNSAGYKVNQQSVNSGGQPNPPAYALTNQGSNSLNKLSYNTLPESYNTSADQTHRDNNWDSLVKQMVADRNNYGSVDEWRNDQIKNVGWNLGPNGISKFYGVGGYSNGEDYSTALVDEAQKRLYGTGNSSGNGNASNAPTYSFDNSGRIAPNYAEMYNKGIADMSALQSGYGASSQGYIDNLNALNPEYEQLRNENAAETRALQGRYDGLGASNTAENNALRGRYDALGASNTAENNALRGRYDALGADSTARNQATINEYNAKMNPLQQGILPTNFTNNQQKILNDSAQQAVGSLLSGLGGSGAINSSLSRQGIGDINYNTQRTMADYFDRSINSLASMAGQQYGNQNTNNTNLYNQGMGVLDANGNLIQRNFTNGMGVLDANGNLIQRNFTNGMGVLDANGNLIQQRFGNGMTGLNAQANNIGNAFNLNQTRFGTQMQGITAPMQFAAASQEAQDAPLTRLISNANTANQYPFNFWNANNASWANMNTPEQTIVTQQEGMGSALGGLAGLAAKFIK